MAVYLDGEVRLDFESPTFYKSISSSSDHLYKPAYTKSKPTSTYTKITTTNEHRQPPKTYLKAPSLTSDYQSEKSATYQNKPLASYSYTPSPYQRPLSYIKLISRLNDHYQSTPKPIYTSIYSENVIQKKVPLSRNHHNPVPTVVISSSRVPLNLDMKTKSTKVKVVSTHENLPPESYQSYSQNGKYVLEEKVIKPAVYNVREIVLPPQHTVVKQVHPSKEEKFCTPNIHYQENYQGQNNYQHKPEVEMEMVPEYEDVDQDDHDHHLPQAVHVYETTPPSYYDYGQMRPTEGNYMYFYQ